MGAYCGLVGVEEGWTTFLVTIMLKKKKKQQKEVTLLLEKCLHQLRNAVFNAMLHLQGDEVGGIELKIGRNVLIKICDYNKE